ncbi:hypothetical protein RCH09_003902 [Actimicrobium sp. GrIS 1.19]|uniref:hypothetical protein n=1 Tax=Actimicrobium sp. GrIS 1.19 TaxID=3071708 RepID=UPI002DFE9A31|nr:hypothetical protein [Actimicrobium sp. GrIS 1.19]
MNSYKAPQSHRAGQFELELYPFVEAPADRHASDAALQYGADFRVQFCRPPQRKSSVALIQLVRSQTRRLPAMIAGAWQVDRGAARPNPVTVAQCAFGDDNSVVGDLSLHYAGQRTRVLSTTACALIDTPRERNQAFSNGVLQGATWTEFANYVVELSSRDGIIFNRGIRWGYAVVQQGELFDVVVQQPTESLLTRSLPHLNAMATFLQLPKGLVAGFIE